MKYLLLFTSILLLFSCEIENDTQSIKGEYALQSYTKLDCNSNADDLVWVGSRSYDEEFSITGDLCIILFNIFSSQLYFEHLDSDLSHELKIGGIVSQIKDDQGTAEFSESPFEDGDCDIADITIGNDLLTWTFVDEEGCEIVLVWEKN